MGEEKKLNTDIAETPRALLDRAFPKQGPCAFCDRQDARHRVFDAIKDRHGAGDSVELLAEDYGVSVGDIRLVLEVG